MAIQYRFVTTDSAGHKTFAVATYVYNLAQMPRPPTSILVRNDAIDSLGTTCTTGYKLAHRQPVDMGWSLDQGFGELMVDHQGYNSAYGAAELGGHAVFDAMLALQQLPSKFIAPQRQFALQGYSGGAQVAFAANKLMGSYAPSLVAQTVGAAMSGYFNAGGGLRSAVAIGLAREYPQMAKYFTPLGVALAHVVHNQCVDVFMYLGVLFSLVPEQAVMVPGAYESAEVQEIFRKTRFDGMRLSVKSLFYHGTDDPWLPYSSVQREYETQRALGADVELLTVHGADHFTAAERAQPQVQTTLKGWFTTNW